MIIFITKFGFVLIRIFLL